MKIFGLNNKNFSKTHGETLVEVIIAIFIVAIGSGAATNLIVSALQANSYSRDNLIALNLAVEGVEAVRDIRDNNWLRFSYDKEGCWNMMPDADCATAGAGGVIQPDFYTVDLDPNDYYQWGLTDVSDELNLDSATADNNDEYRLSFIDVNVTEDSDNIGGPTDDPDLYVSQTIAGGSTVSDTKFYRMVEISYPQTNNAVDDDEMQVTSVVQWKTGAAVHEVRFSSFLTNYQKIKR